MKGILKGKSITMGILGLLCAVMFNGMTAQASLKITLTEDNFDYEAYADTYPDLKKVFGYDKELLWQHYVESGKAEGRVATVSLDSLITESNFDYDRFVSDYAELLAPLGTTDHETLWLFYSTIGKDAGLKAYSTNSYINTVIRVEAKAAEIVNDSMSDYEKIKAVHDWMCANIEYDYDNFLNGTIPASSYTVDGALDGIAVCQGYAEAFEMFMDVLGIECETVTGVATNSSGYTGGHAWNQVKLNGQWYNIDVTWDDPIYTFNGVRMQHTRYDYFLISNSKMNANHTPNGTVHDCQSNYN